MNRVNLRSHARSALALQVEGESNRATPFSCVRFFLQEKCEKILLSSCSVGLAAVSRRWQKGNAGMRRQSYSKLFRGWRMVPISWRLAAASLGALLLAAGWSFQASLAQAPATPTIALTGARLIDGAGGAP